MSNLNSLQELRRAAALVAPQWRKEFERFVETGEANGEFLIFLRSDENCRKACETALRADKKVEELITQAVLHNKKRLK